MKTILNITVEANTDVWKHGDAGSSLGFILSLFTELYKWVLETYCWDAPMDMQPFQGEVVLLLVALC